MALKDYLNNFNLRLEDVARIKNRVMIVGQFNNDPEVKAYLFSHRCGDDPLYEDSFEASCDLEYRNFIQELRPSLTEVRQQPDAKRGRPFGWFELQRPSSTLGSSSETRASSVINEADYFFVRAASASDQEWFQSEEGRADLLQTRDSDRGRQILTRIRKQLASFSRFQPSVPQLVRGFMEVISQCSSMPLPFYAPGAPLPGGLAEAVVELLFDEDVTRQIDFSRVNFKTEDGDWEQIEHDAEARENLKVAIHAYRDRMRGKAAQYNDNLVFGQPIGDVIDDIIGDDDILGRAFHRRFRSAQEAYSELRQILKNKALLGFVFQWLLDGYKDLEAVRDLRDASNPAKLYRAIQSEIVDGTSSELPQPVRRLALDERRRFSRELEAHFATVIDAIVGEGDTADLPGELQGLVSQLQADARIVTALRTLTGADGDGMQEGLKEGFLSSMQDYIRGILCPALYKEPGLSGEELADFRSQEVTNLYLAAVLLTRDNVRSIRKIGESYADRLEERVSDDSTLGESADLEAGILGEMISYLSNEELVSAVSQAQRELRSAMMARAADAQSALAGADSAAAGFDFAIVRPGDDMAEAVSEASPERVLVQERARSVAKKVGQVMANVAKGVPDAPESPSGAEEPPAAHADSALAAVLRACADVVTEPDALQPFESIPEERRTLDERVAAVVASMAPEDRVDEAKVAEALAEDEGFVAGVTRDQVAYYKGLNYIYGRYAEEHVPEEFRYKVERLTLSNIMLQLTGELGLGKDGSHLYQLLLDLVVHTDRENPQQESFIREVSLTRYVDTAKVRGSWFHQLEQTLANQGRTILDEVIGFISDLRGVHYLFRVLEHHPEAEIIVVNATAEAFTSWIKEDNFGAGQRRLRVGKLADSVEAERRKFIAPAMVYITDSAFKRAGVAPKISWVQGVFSDGGFQASFLPPNPDDDARVVMPPLCLSVGGASTWKEDGKKLAAIAGELAVPLVVPGPSPALNRSQDGFPTILPAGYLLCAHLLGVTGQTIRNPGLDDRSEGRFYMLGSGSADMSTSLNRLVWGPPNLKRVVTTNADGEEQEQLVSPSHPFAADFYLYLLVTLMAHAANHGGLGRGSDRKVSDLFKYVVKPRLKPQDFRQSEVLGQALFWGDAMRCMLDGNPAKEGLRSVLVAQSPGTSVLGKEQLLPAEKVSWFANAMKILHLS